MTTLWAPAKFGSVVWTCGGVYAAVVTHRPLPGGVPLSFPYVVPIEFTATRRKQVCLPMSTESGQLTSCAAWSCSPRSLPPVDGTSFGMWSRSGPYWKCQCVSRPSGFTLPWRTMLLGSVIAGLVVFTTGAAVGCGTLTSIERLAVLLVSVPSLALKSTVRVAALE